ncbi:MAG: LPP20 family lipoprotein [Bacteroidales bacterium]|nr:LPP20 family lipoprotein [Bacteroidales bacterium]
MKASNLGYKTPLLIWLFILYSCSASNISAVGGNKPQWVKERPVSDEYYIGIGMADKNQDNYISIAKSNALSDMVSEISVNISSNSVLRQFEDQEGFREEFQSITKMNMKDELEGYELVDSYNGKENYWVYYRLAIDKYQKIKREKLERAKNLAKDFFEKAKESEKNYDIHNALNYYAQAFDALKAHLDEDLSVFVLNKGRINLGNAIYQNIQEIFSNLKVMPAKEVFQLRALSEENPSVKAIVYYETNDTKNRIADLPFTFSFPELNIEKTENVHSNSSGEMICSIANRIPGGKQRKIKTVLNTQVYFGEKSEKNLLNQMFRLQGSVPYGYLTINVTNLKAYFQAEETEFGKSVSENPVANIFKKALSEHYFSFVPDLDKAEVIIKVTANTKEGKKMDQYDLHTAYLNCNISITNASTNEEVYSTALQNIKGMKSGSFRMAARDAREKAQKRIQQQIIPELRQIKF